MEWFFKFCRDACRIAFWFWFRTEFEGVENIPAGGSRYIVASNHVSYVDPVMLALRIRPMICYVAKEELTSGKLRPLFLGLGVVPIDRGSGDFSIADRCAARLEQGHMLGIFPEGTRHLDGQPGRPKSGLALIAKTTRADVLPCCVIYEPGKNRGFRSRVMVRYGKLIPHGELGIEDDSPRSLKVATKLVWDRVLGLMERGFLHE